jgi:hypothetical protein
MHKPSPLGSMVVVSPPESVPRTDDKSQRASRVSPTSSLSTVSRSPVSAGHKTVGQTGSPTVFDYRLMVNWLTSHRVIHRPHNGTGTQPAPAVSPNEDQGALLECLPCHLALTTKHTCQLRAAICQWTLDTCTKNSNTWADRVTKSLPSWEETPKPPCLANLATGSGHRRGRSSVLLQSIISGVVTVYGVVRLSRKYIGTRRVRKACWVFDPCRGASRDMLHPGKSSAMRTATKGIYASCHTPQRREDLNTRHRRSTLGVALVLLHTELSD